MRPSDHQVETLCSHWFFGRGLGERLPALLISFAEEALTDLRQEKTTVPARRWASRTYLGRYGLTFRSRR